MDPLADELATLLQLAQQGESERVGELLQARLQQDDQDARVWFALAEVRRLQQDARPAFTAYLATVKRNPEHAQAHYWLSVLLQQDHVLDALRHVQLALEFNPELPEAMLQLQALYRILAERGFEGPFRQQLAQRPEEVPDLLNALTLLPAVPDSEAEIQTCVKVLQDVVQILGQTCPRFDPSRLTDDLGFPQMLTYYGLEGQQERRLREDYADIFSHQLEPLPLPASKGRAKIAFVAGQNRAGVLLRFQGELMRALAQLRPQIQWLLAAPAGLADQVRQTLPGWEYLALPNHLPQAAALLAKEGIDLLYYWEFGLEPLSYFLAFYKPARIQCAGIGWPVTSGVATMDYYLSSAVLESPTAQRFYSETLCLQTGLAYPGLLPTLPAHPFERSHWGFDSTQHLYLCLQDPLKLHPKLDPLFGNILTADPQGILVLLSYQPQMGKKLYQRLLRQFPQHAGRIRMLPRQPTPAYLSLILTAEVVLDSWPYCGGGGTNSDLLACGTPMVTLPGSELRSNITSRLLQAVGLTELIARSPADYVNRAVQLAQDKSLRQRLSHRLQTEGQSLLKDPAGIRHFAELLENLLDTHPN